MAAGRLLHLPDHLQLSSGNVSQNWKRFKQKWSNYELQSQAKIVGDTLAKRCFFPSRAHLVPLKVVYRGSVTKSCTPTLRGQGDPKVSQPF